MAGISWRFQPAFWREDIVAAVSVDVAHADAVAVAVVADDVLHHAAVSIFLVPGQRAIVSKLRQNLFCFAVVVEVHQE